MDRQPAEGAPLDEETARFLETGESITVASRDVRCVPSVIKAMGCRVAADRRRVTVLVAASQSRQLIADVRATRAIAVVWSRPTTHHTLQVKGSDAVVELPAEGDAGLAREHRQAFARQLVPVGYRLDWALAIHDLPPEDMVAITFSVDAVYMQTPGPGAGARLGQTP